MMIPPGMTDTGTTSPVTGTPLSAPRTLVTGSPDQAPLGKHQGAPRVGPENLTLSGNPWRRLGHKIGSPERIRGALQEGS